MLLFLSLLFSLLLISHDSLNLIYAIFTTFFLIVPSIDFKTSFNFLLNFISLCSLCHVFSNYISMTFFLSLCLRVFLSQWCLHVLLFLSMSFFLSLYLSFLTHLYDFLSHFISMSFFLSVSISFFLSLSLSLCPLSHLLSVHCIFLHLTSFVFVSNDVSHRHNC